VRNRLDVPMLDTSHSVAVQLIGAAFPLPHGLRWQVIEFPSALVPLPYPSAICYYYRSESCPRFRAHSEPEQAPSTAGGSRETMLRFRIGEARIELFQWQVLVLRVSLGGLRFTDDKSRHRDHDQHRPRGAVWTLKDIRLCNSRFKDPTLRSIRTASALH